MQKMLNFDKAGETIEASHEIQNENYGNPKIIISLNYLSVKGVCLIIRFLRGEKK